MADQINEFNIVARFPNPWGTPDNKRSALVANNAVRPGQRVKWAPDEEDFAAIATAGKSGPPVVVQSIGDLFSKILRHQAGSITRLNLFAHANPGLIALHGTLRIGARGVVDVIAAPGNDTSLDTVVINNLLNISRLHIEFGTFGSAFLEPIRAQFAKNATIYVFACNTGGQRGLPQPPQPELLNAVATLFNVRVIGFRDAVQVCVEFPVRGRLRKESFKYRVGIGGSEVCGNPPHDFGTSVVDFHDIERNFANTIVLGLPQQAAAR